MRQLLFLLLGCIVECAAAQSTDEQQLSATRARYLRIFAIEDRIQETRPRRRDAPLREENIRDEEVREIQAAVREILPEAIVNIAGVVTGCPCEEGLMCTDQVWILALRGNDTLGLQFSKFAGHWGVSAIQLWWFEYEELQKQQSSFASYEEYTDAVHTLEERFPHCTENLWKTTDGR